jgi:acyl-CoA synthetase (AMP-forming)/AMP-acid ligase II
VELTIPAALGAAAGKFGDGPALAEPGGPRISYHQLLHQTTTVTRALIAEGVRPGDRVAIWSPNTHHWVLGAFGALSAGATLVPVSTRFTGPEALDVIRRSGASALIVADRFLGIDRLAALCEAAEGQAAESARARATTESPIVEERNLAGGPVTPGKLRLVVRVPMPDPAERGTATGPEGHQLGGAAGPGGHGARWRGGTERRSGAPR